MRWLFVFAGFMAAAGVSGQEKAAPKPAPALTLAQYLDQVKAGGFEARSTIESLKTAELRVNEAEVPYSPEFYSEYRLFNDRKEPLNAFSPSETDARVWKLGVRDQTTFGLSADVNFTSQHTLLQGGNSAMIPIRDYEQSSLGLQLKQSLWRNSFGESSRAAEEAQRAASRLAVLKQKFALKNLMLKAENTYWSLVSFNQIVKLQEENVERARRLRDWMRQRASMRLFDDVDALQAQASFETRELELQTSLDERAGLLRTFNTLRGQAVDKLEELSELPTGELMTKTVNDKSKRMSREDFRMIYEEAQASDAKARADYSRIRPQLDLEAALAGNGLDRTAGDALSEAGRGRHPMWSVGLVFSLALDYRLVGDMKASYRAQRRAAADMKQQAAFGEERAWDELVKQNREAQGRYERALSLEKLQTELVKRERQRLLNGRTTTFQSISIEQNLAAAQINRVRAQLALLQLHNLIKQFEEMP